MSPERIHMYLVANLLIQRSFPNDSRFNKWLVATCKLGLFNSCSGSHLPRIQ